jgi:hypothetical protein
MMPRQTKIPRLRLFIFCGVLAGAALFCPGFVAAQTPAANAPGATAPANVTANATIGSAAKSMPNVFPALAPVPHYDPNNPPQGIFDDEWMEEYIDGKKTGYSHQVFRRTGDHIFTDLHEVSKVGRAGSLLETSDECTTEETVDGKIIAFHSSTSLSNQPTVVDGKSNGSGFDITLQSGAYHEEKRVTFPEGTVATWGEQRLTLLKGLDAGTNYPILLYDPTTDPFQPLTEIIAVGGREKVTVGGQEIEAVRVNEHITPKSGIGGADSQCLADTDGRLLKSTTPLGSYREDLMASTEQQALAEFVPADIFTGSLITLDRPVPPDDTTVVFHLRRADGKPLTAPPESAAEHGAVLPDGSVRLTLTRLAPSNSGQAGELKDPAPYLAQNSFLDTKDLRLVDLAAQLGGPPDAAPATVAGLLRDAVTTYINKKDLSVGFATASEAAERREGDCTEHAVLLAALGRIRGLPARVVCGFAYMPEYQGSHAVLGFHMWAQFYLDGRWVDYDSALNDSKAPKYWRLGLVASDLNDVSLSDFTLALMGWMSDMKVTVESTPTPPAK